MPEKTALVALVLLVACGPSQQGLVPAELPQASPAYDKAILRWTRHASHSRNFETVIDAHATLMSADWRAAYVTERVRRARLGPDDAAELAGKEQARAEEVWEIELVTATHDFAANDFARGERSMWIVRLVGDEGRAVAPIEIREDHRPKSEIGSWFPGFGPFHRAHVLTFPKNAADGRPLAAGGALRLKLGSALGAVELGWAAR